MSFSQEYDVGNLHLQHLLDNLDSQRKEGLLCDVVLSTGPGGEEFSAHRCLLAATSTYFRTMFAEEHNFTENTTGIVHLHSIDTEALEAILNMIYTGKLRLNLENVYSVVSAADHFLLDDVINHCVNFMFSVLNSKHAANEVLKIKNTAEMYSLMFVEPATNAVLSKHITSVLESQAFLELPCDSVVNLLQHDSIHGYNETVFWEAALRWLKHDLKTRKVYLPLLMENIRFALMDAATLLLVVQPNELVQSSACCQKMLVDAIKFKLLPEMQSVWSLGKHYRPRYKSDDTAIYCLSGWQHFKCYLPLHDQWYSLRPPEDLATVETPKGCTAKKSVLTVEGSVFVAFQVSQPEEVYQF